MENQKMIVVSLQIDDDHTTTPILTEKEKGYIIDALQGKIRDLKIQITHLIDDDTEVARNFSELVESYEHLIERVNSLGSGLQFSDSPACKISLSLLLKAQKRIEQLINLTPSGDQINILCDENI